MPSGKYFVSFNIECEHKKLPKNSNAIGLDLGISDLLITSDGETFENKKLTYKKSFKEFEKIMLIKRIFIASELHIMTI